ncbi:MAG: hypothetical protein QOJ80_689 [Mycobacterium sp.]|jgi:uncharacterized protein (TIGR03083 family)|nr:hypothetical protein [Mycobacterium sp.]MDT5399029.1 hypothetical protein [Mycobacterium sp.]
MELITLRWHSGLMDRLAIIGSEAQRFAEALSVVDPARECPTCPDWTASDLLWHLTNVHFFWAGILERRIQSPADLPAVERAKPERPAALAELLRLREQATAALLRELADRDDAEPCWSWWPPDQTVGFTRRMQTYEATMHRVDAELTAGTAVTPISAEVSAGAVDHAVDVMWGWMPEGASYRAHAVLEFVATDTPQTWLVEVGAWTAPDDEGGTGPRAVRATAGEPTATVRASAEDLALWAWTRGGSVQTSGQPASLAAMDAVLSQGMP